MKSLEEILEELMNYCRQCAMNGDCLNCGQKTINIEQAAQEIKELIKAKLPKKEKYPLQTPCTCGCYQNGFNHALTGIIKIVEEE